MHRHVRHLVNTCHIESLIQDLELFPFQGICSVSIITESALQQSLHYEGGKIKPRKESWSFQTRRIEMATPFLSSAWFKCKDNSELEMENQPTNQPTYNISLLTNPDHPVFFSLHLYPRGDGEWRRQGKKKRDRWDGKDSQ